eukprot:2313876-Prymnesium_polylepis.1
MGRGAHVSRVFYGAAARRGDVEAAVAGGGGRTLHPAGATPKVLGGTQVPGGAQERTWVHPP